MAILTTSNAFLIQQQAAEIQRTRDIMNRIGYVPQGGPQNTHGNVNRAVDLGHRTSIEQGPGNMASFAEGGPSFVEGLGIDLNGDG
ncbi:MAG: hypothetical protein KC800_02520, partial [Candidatus Eremiobacteraeota bacterium]|nr:hypothetical protein [Candidatus Eremiobacteraeota bacterium]